MWKVQKKKQFIESIDEIAKVLHMAETADIALIGIGLMQDDFFDYQGRNTDKGRIQGTSEEKVPLEKSLEGFMTRMARRLMRI